MFRVLRWRLDTDAKGRSLPTSQAGFDRRKIAFIFAIYAFLRNPFCMKVSEKKRIANMDFLVNELGCKPVAVAQCPVLLNFNLNKRMKPRCFVVQIWKAAGLLKNTIELRNHLVDDVREEVVEAMHFQSSG
ncbi:UNVERIFIED_CONTAM: hypothetical protein Sradi_0292400 [Sesamum radiatum]|uniref:Uncharacterized protein n=1 Tax=Sesamum radiatum TaxID=300843 RepID=A0AAW2W3T1_SESRA